MTDRGWTAVCAPTSNVVHSSMPGNAKTLCGLAVTDAFHEIAIFADHDICARCWKALARGKHSDPADVLTVNVPVWKVTWGTCALLLAAATGQDAISIARRRDETQSPGRVAREFYVCPATQADIDAATEAGKWNLPAPVHTDQGALFADA